MPLDQASPSGCTWLLVTPPCFTRPCRRALAALPPGAWLINVARGALIDEVVLRLAGLSAVLWLAVVAIGRRTPVADGLAILITAAVLWPLSAWGYLTALDGSLLTVLRELCLHVAAGVLWGWLYCRHGWLAGVIGHVSAHLILQPALALLV